MKIKVHYRSRVSSVGLKLNKVGVSSLALLIIGLVAGGLGIKYSSELSKDESVFASHPECNQYATNISNAFCLQDMNDSVAESMVVGRQYRLHDKRDDKLYYIAKLADGNVWMTQNLDLDLNKNVKLTPADSDVVADWTPAESTIVSECIDEDEDGTCEDLDLAFDEVGTKNTTPESYDVGDLYWNGIVGDCDTCTQYQTYITSDSSNTHYHLGNFYNWSAATANNDSSALVAGGEVEQSICPAGWSLPTALELPETNRRARDYMTLLSYYATEDAFDEFPLVGFSVEEDFNSAPYSSPLYFGYFREPGYYGGYWSSLYERSNDERTPYLATDLEISVEEEGYIGISSFIERKMILNVRCVAKSREAVPEPQPEPVEQVVSFAASSVSKSFGDARFTNAASTTGDGVITYSSSNASVATVDSTSGEVTIVGVGSATITASAAATDNYLAASASYTLTVSKANRTVSFGASSVSKTYGDAIFINIATKTGDGAIVYSSSNVSVAAVNSSTGEVTITGVGLATITASVVATSNYNAGSASYALTVNKANRNVSFGSSAVTKTYGDGEFTNAATKTGDGAIVYSSNNVSVASINSSTGEITITGAGSATITASVAATTNYNVGSASYTLTVNKANRTVSFENNEVAKVYGDDKFIITAAKTGDGTIAYSSNNTSIAEVSTNGEVTIKAAGSATITANVAATSNYNAGSATYTLTVNKANRTVSFEGSEVVKVYGDDKFTNVATKTGDGVIVYSSSDGSVAMVDSSTGEITINRAGSAIITASVAATSNYNAGSASYTLTVSKANRTISFGSSAITKVYGDANFTNVATRTGDGTIAYSSNNTSIAEVSTNGEVTIKAAGSATITASVAATSNYNAGSATYALTVNKKESVKPEEVSEVKEGYVTDKLSTIELETKGLVWDDENEQIEEGKNSYVVNYTENADSANYTTESFEIEVDGKHRKYEVVDGDKQTYILGSEEYMSFTFDADYTLFEEGGEVYINEDLLDEEDYVSESGSTVIKVADEYLKTLDEGKYTLAVYFNDGGIATTSFTLEEPEVAVPDTGAHTKSNDKTTSVGAYILPFSAFALFSAFSVIARKKQKVCFDRK